VKICSVASSISFGSEFVGYINITGDDCIEVKASNILIEMACDYLYGLDGIYIFMSEEEYAALAKHIQDKLDYGVSIGRVFVGTMPEDPLEFSKNKYYSEQQNSTNENNAEQTDKTTTNAGGS
jgi:hypothetical protein